MPRSRHKRLDCSPGCAVEGTPELISGKWKGVVLYHLFEGAQRTLTIQLRAPEADGLISRRVYPVVPPKVEYSLTPRGRSLEPVIRALRAWGDEHVDLAPKTAKADAVAAVRHSA
ncbi:helix-turn-helix domain-containing protein [Breoghania sp. L-A4]|uniref:winged helix-turn-helix transcriptional regulator n=1 Tax=Breoghania sp. L-A4 TaxID=2304600 RepID=UPI000E35C738|nr:helix-turn-helix domain-containing protein [Breoghania sp. L-A4]AXS40723.1 transcriptional regulator [Breoghania sp. L-A4]